MEKCSWFFSYKKFWFLGLKHITPKCSQNKILAAKKVEEPLVTEAISGPFLEIGTTKK
jgi:hypothetical protein